MACGGELSSPEAAISLQRSLRKINCASLVLAHTSKSVQAKLKPVAAMIHELQKRPGLKALVRAHGDHAMFLAQLIQAATIYHARKGR
jgi:hypothetical protein